VDDRPFPNAGRDTIKTHRTADGSTESHNCTEHNKAAQYSRHTPTATKQLKKQTASSKKEEGQIPEECDENKKENIAAKGRVKSKIMHGELEVTEHALCSRVRG
jgi:hypothetical protein